MKRNPIIPVDWLPTVAIRQRGSSTEDRRTTYRRAKCARCSMPVLLFYDLLNIFVRTSFTISLGDFLVKDV